MPNNGLWRDLHKTIHSVLNATSRQIISQFKCVRPDRRAGNLLDTYEQRYLQARRYTISTVMQVAYGRSVPSWNGKDVQDIYIVINNLKIKSPGEWIVDSFRDSRKNSPLATVQSE